MQDNIILTLLIRTRKKQKLELLEAMQLNGAIKDLKDHEGTFIASCKPVSPVGQVINLIKTIPNVHPRIDHYFSVHRCKETQEVIKDLMEKHHIHPTSFPKEKDYITFYVVAGYLERVTNHLDKLNIHAIPAVL